MPYLEVREYGLDRARKALRGFRQPELDKALLRITLSAARSQVVPIRRAAPKGATGNLKRSIRATKARRGLGAVVGPKAGRAARKGAPHRHLVILGTRPHRIRSSRQVPLIPKALAGVFGAIQHPGSRANPFVDRAIDTGRMDQFIERGIARELAKAEKGPR